MSQPNHSGKSYTITSYFPPVAGGHKSVVSLKPIFDGTDKFVELDFSKFKGHQSPFLLYMGLAKSLSSALLICLDDLDEKESS